MADTKQLDRPGCDTSEMLVVHRLFRRVFGEAPDLVLGVPSGDAGRVRAVGDHLLLIARGLHGHHSTEDTLLWDELASRALQQARRLGAEVLVTRTIVRIAPSVKSSGTSSSPHSLRCRGTRYFTAMFSFSNSVYPLSWMISIRSCSGTGMPDSEFAVVMNITSERS